MTTTLLFGRDRLSPLLELFCKRSRSPASPKCTLARDAQKRPSHSGGFPGPVVGQPEQVLQYTRRLLVLPLCPVAHGQDIVRRPKVIGHTLRLRRSLE